MYDPRFDALPVNPSKHVWRLARDLAWGVHNNDWPDEFYIRSGLNWEFTSHGNYGGNNPVLCDYLNKMWKNKPPVKSLIKSPYIREKKIKGDGISLYELTNEGLRLTDGAEAASIFISYRRAESSAFALLIVARLKELGLSPYLDMHPDPDIPNNRLRLGKKWEDDLKAAVNEKGSFVLLLAPTTLKDDSFVLTELDWALRATPTKRIIPVWHNHFDIKNPDHLASHVPPHITEFIKSTHGVRVASEDPEGYDSAIRKLFAELGIKS